MLELVFASHNANKAREIAMLMPPGIKIFSLDEIGYHNEIEETADTFTGNALLKARAVYLATHKNCFADDSGLEVDALNGAPGVHSARYAGKQGNSEANIEKLLNAMKSKQSHSARFICVFALIINGKEEIFEGIVEGKISDKKRGKGGFGYDPVFIPDGYDMTFAEMNPEEKNRISHRAKALRLMVEYLSNLSART